MKIKNGGEGRNRTDDGAFAELCLSHLATPPWEAGKVNKARLQVNDGGINCEEATTLRSAKPTLKHDLGDCMVGAENYLDLFSA